MIRRETIEENQLDLLRQHLSVEYIWERATWYVILIDSAKTKRLEV